jgi:non-heme Fe2+,alpha-ketoglutarate-dependent halogenase
MTNTEMKSVVKPIPLVLGYALGKLTPLHRFMPDALLYRLPLSWNAEMLRSFLVHRRDRIYIDVSCELDLPYSYAPRAEVSGAHALSEDEVRAFYQDGFLGPFELCPAEEMRARADEMWALWDAPSQIYPRGSYRFTGDSITATRTDEMCNEEYATRGLNARDKHLQDPGLLDLYAHPAIVNRIAGLLGPDIMMWRSQLFPKYPNMGGTGWHQASAYLNETMRVATLTPPNLRSLFQVTAWIAITDSTRENGCLRFVRGSHRRIEPMKVEEFDPVKHADNKSDRFGTRVLRTYDDIDPRRVVELPMRAGQFVLFSERLLHGSLPNSTDDESRLGMSARYVTPDVEVHNPWVLGAGGLDISFLRINGLRLDRWRAIMVRGVDRFGVNGDRVVPYTGRHAQEKRAR